MDKTNFNNFRSQIEGSFLQEDRDHFGGDFEDFLDENQF